ncbi:hypothetical protein J5N97_024229 [Dioscorea zingiberensis]|uniref:Uncharacterized protein n=1 Tax=Dioscorea zingiberensis TaxID=325984 RepID=A0A9D5C644_9LILI|nr:hypothetical protein J5N97_024229 [Dioscorea zingiberensis]
MELPSIPPTIDHKPQGLDDFDNFAQTQPLIVDMPRSSISKTKGVRKGAKRMKGEDLEIMRKVSNSLDRIANAMEVDKVEKFITRLYAEVMTLSDHYTHSDLGEAFDYLISQNNLGYAFMAKDYSLRCHWMDRFLRQLKGDGGMR